MLKKEREMREKILNRIEKLLQAGSKLNEAEKKILMDYYEQIEKSKNMEFELVHLRNALLPLVISSQHSLNVLKFYKELRSERKVTWGEGSSLLTGIAQFPEKMKGNTYENKTNLCKSYDFSNLAISSYSNNS